MRITLTLLYANATKQPDPESMQVNFFCKAETGATTILLQWTWTSCSCSTSEEEDSSCHPVAMLCRELYFHAFCCVCTIWAPCKGRIFRRRKRFPTIFFFFFFFCAACLVILRSTFYFVIERTFYFPLPAGPSIRGCTCTELTPRPMAHNG